MSEVEIGNGSIALAVVISFLLGVHVGAAIGWWIGLRAQQERDAQVCDDALRESSGYAGPCCVSSVKYLAKKIRGTETRS